MSSTFPTTIDNIPSFLDVTTADATLLSQFETAIQSGNFTLASSILSQIQNSDQKIITASRLNQLRDAILALEQFYSSDIVTYVNQKQAEWQAIVDRFGYIADFSPSVPYIKNNIVSYSANGNKDLYICKVNTLAGILPTNTIYWLKFTIVGMRGDSGSNGVSFSFDWSSSFLYSANTIVTYNGEWWYSTQSNQNQVPIEGSSVWEKVMSAPQEHYPIQTAQPTNQVTGDLWFKLLT